MDDAYLIHLGRPMQDDPLDEEPVPDHALYVAIRENLGYVGYLGPVDRHVEIQKMLPAGDPGSLGTHGTNNIDYPPGTGLDLATVQRLLNAFRASAILPAFVDWVADKQ